MKVIEEGKTYEEQAELNAIADEGCSCDEKCVDSLVLILGH